MILSTTIRPRHNGTLPEGKTPEVRNRHLLVVRVGQETNERPPSQGVCYMEDRDRRPLEDGGQRSRLAKNEVETNLNTVCGRKSEESYHRIY
jgi:hypothetical protein